MKRALVLSLICVLGFAFGGMAASLTGYWDTDVTIDPTLASFADAISLTSDLSVTYTIGSWDFTSLTELTDAGWLDQTFAIGGVLGAFTIASGVDFDPVGGFDELTLDVDISIAGVLLSGDFTLAGGSVDLDLGASGVAGAVTIGMDVFFGDPGVGCDLDWTGVNITVGFPFDCVDLSLVVAFDCTGFLSATFTTGGIVIPNLPWVTIDAELVFTLENKELTLSPVFVWGDIACFDLDISVTSDPVANSPLVLGEISVDAIYLTVDIGAVTFSAFTDFTGTLPYFEEYKIETSDEACCGPFSFDVTFKFTDNGTELFDLGAVVANMELQVASQLVFNMGLSIDVEAGAFTNWIIGFLVTW